MQRTSGLPLFRAAVSVLALVGLLISVYLTLYKYGYMGILPCGVGACDIVQSSSHAYLLGYPVALWGVPGYALILAVALAGTHPPLDESIAVSRSLLLLTGGAFAFSMYLTYLEAFVIHAWCRYCVASALIATACFVLSILDARIAAGSPPATDPTRTAAPLPT